MAKSSGHPLVSPPALLRFFLTMAVGLAADLWTKSWAAKALLDGPIDFIHGWVQFEFIENKGAVFGFAPDHRMLFLVVSVVAVLFLSYLFSTSRGRPFNQIILGMLLAGVLGNMYDRVVFGHVRDMIHVLPTTKWPAGFHNKLHLPEFVFPYIFNVADSLLCVGVGLMLIYSFVTGPTPAPTSRTSTGDATPSAST